MYILILFLLPADLRPISRPCPPKVVYETIDFWERGDVTPTPIPQSGGPNCLPLSRMGGPTSSKAIGRSDIEFTGAKWLIMSSSWRSYLRESIDTITKDFKIICTGESLSSPTSRPDITIALSKGQFGIKTPCISLVSAFLCEYYWLEMVLLCCDADIIFGRKWSHRLPNNAEEHRVKW
jgi:hypothetical protein